MKILMGTKNPGKIEGARQAFEKYFDSVEIEGISVESNVGAQPVNEEILQGAKNRIKNLKKYANTNNIKADFYIASEAGITNLLGEWIDINAVIIEDSKGFQSIGTSQGFPIPDKYIEEIKKNRCPAPHFKCLTSAFLTLLTIIAINDKPLITPLRSHCPLPFSLPESS